VVVGEVVLQYAVEVRRVENDDVIQAFAPHRTDQPFHIRRLPGRVGRDAEFLQTQGLGAVLELLPVNAVAVTKQVLWGRSKGEGFPELPGSPGRRGALHDVKVEHLAALVGQDKEDIEEAEAEGGTVKKSTDTICPRWLRRNVVQVWDEGRREPGTMYLATVRCARERPSLSNSPWIRGAPQRGLARLICRIKLTASPSIGRRPPRRGQLCHFQNWRKPARCQRTTVSGCTIRRQVFQDRQRRASQTQRARSGLDRRGSLAVR